MLGVPTVYGVAPVDPYESTIELHLYSPCKIKLGFDYTTNMSVSDVSSLGPSLYTIVSSPFDVSFEASDIDTFSFQVTLRYAVTTAQSMSLAMFSGSVPPQKIPLPVQSKSVQIKFVVTIMAEPKYPTVDQILESIFPHFKSELQIYHSDNVEMIESVKTTVAYIYYLVALMAVALIVLAGVVLITLRRIET